MARSTYNRWLFRIAAVWCWAISAGFYFGQQRLAAALGLPADVPRILMDMTILPVFLFGFAYWWVSRDVTQNHLIPALGAIGGALTFLVFVARALSGDIPGFLVLPATIDLLFGLLFFEFLLWTGRERHNA